MMVLESLLQVATKLLLYSLTVSNPSGPSQTPPGVPEGPKGTVFLGINPYIIGVYGFLLTSGSMHDNP